MAGSEVVKYGSEVIADPSVQRLIGNTLGAPIAEVAAWLADEVRYHRVKRQTKMWTRASEMLEDAGLEATPIGPVNPAVVVPLLESGSLVEDEQLFEKWAALLAAAARGDDRVHPSYPDILRQLTPREAAILDAAHVDAGPRWATTPFEPYVVAERAGFPIPATFEGIEHLENPEAILAEIDANLLRSVDNLLRLRLVKPLDVMDRPIKSSTSKVLLTSLGHDFVGACKPPTS